MRIAVLSVCLMMVLTGCGVEWFPGDETTSSVTITTTTLADAPTGLSYSQTLAASGGTTPHTWTLESGSALPAGLTLSTGGIIAGIPTTPAPVPTTTPVYTFTVKVTDSAATPATTTRSLSISTPITVSDSTNKVFARILSFNTTQGLTVTVKNTDIVVHTVQVAVANYDNAGIEIPGSAFNMTPLTVTAGAETPIINAPPTTYTVNNWRIKSVSIN